LRPAASRERSRERRGGELEERGGEVRGIALPF